MPKISSLFCTLAFTIGLSGPLWAQDTTPPSAGVVSPVDGSYVNSLLSIDGTAADDTAVSEAQLRILRQSDGYSWDGAAFISSGTWLAASFADPAWSYVSLPAWADGESYLVIARSSDTSANLSAVYSTSVFHFDSGLPVSAVTAPLDGSFVSTFTGVNGTAWDGGSSVAQVLVKLTRLGDGKYWDAGGSQWSAAETWNPAAGSATWTWTGPAPAALTAGATYFAVSRAADLAGNLQVSEVAGSTFVYSGPDVLPPAAALLQPLNGAVLNSLPELSGTAADNVAVSSVAVAVRNDATGLYWGGFSWGAGQAWLGASIWASSWTYAGVPAWVNGSSYTITAKAMDSSGNWSVVYGTAAFVYDSQPPYASVIKPLGGTDYDGSELDGIAALNGTAADAALPWAGDQLHAVQLNLSYLDAGSTYYWTGVQFSSSAVTFDAAWQLAIGTGTWRYTFDGDNWAQGKTYALRVRAFDKAAPLGPNGGNEQLPWTVVNFTVGLEVTPGALSGVAVSSLTVNWDTDFGAGTRYYVRLATQAAPVPYLYSGSTLASSLPFTGLTPDTFYYAFVSTAAASGFLASGSGRTLAAAPASVSFSGVGYSSAALTWATGGNPAWTVYAYELSESAVFAVLTSSGSGAVTGAMFTGLAQGATYYGRVRAENADGLPTAYAQAGAPAVTRLLLTAGSASELSGAALGVSSIAWSWNSGSLSAADYFSLYSAPGVQLATAPFAASASFTQGGLGANTPHVLRVAGGNVNGESVLAASATVYTLARTPADPSSQVAFSSAVLTLGLNGNAAGTALQLWRSADNLFFSNLYEGTALSYADAGLGECSAYYYKARARNGAGFYSPFSGTLSFTTMASTPAAPGGLYAEALDGARIALAWEPSPSAPVYRYSVYSDSASGSVDYAAPLAVFSSTVTSWTTPALAAGSTYKFSVRSGGACGTEDKNTSLLASAQAVGLLSGVRAAIKVPQTGKRVKGNMVTVAAELILGLPSQVTRVRFQYSPAGAGAWADIPAANANHPNPDRSAPYFVHMDVGALAPGAYDLRAVATDSYGDADPAAPSVTVEVGAADYDINETVTAGEQSKEQKINNSVTSTVLAADDSTALVTKVVIPSGAVTDSTASVTLVNNPGAVPAPPVGADSLSLALKINLSNGQSQLAGGKAAALTFTYKDDDGNGIVDGSLAPVERLRVYSVPDSGGAWTPLETSVDREKKTVTASTTHFSFFSVFAAAASGLTGVKVYPVPWQPGAGGRFDAAGVTFSGLPASARIKIFTITGELVRMLEISAADAGFKFWDGRNSEGHKAASGVYLAVVKAGSDERTYKVAVER